MVQRASGLMRTRGPTASNTGSAARVAAWKRLRPVSQAPNGSTRARHRLDLADRRSSASVSRPCSVPSGSSARQRRCGRRLHDAQVGQAEIGGQRVAIVERLVEMLAGVEEEHRQVAVDLRDHVQQHRRIGAEGRHRRDLADEIALAPPARCTSSGVSSP